MKKQKSIFISKPKVYVNGKEVAAKATTKGRLITVTLKEPSKSGFVSVKD